MKNSTPAPRQFDPNAFMDSLDTGIEIDADKASAIASGFARPTVESTDSEFKG